MIRAHKALMVLFTVAATLDVNADRVELRRVPDGGIQPQVALDAEHRVHLVYYKGQDTAGDLFYAYSENDGETYSSPARVNSTPSSAIAAGTIRGAHIALGRNGRVHVAWNGSGRVGGEHGSPMLYARFDPATRAFSRQRNLMTKTGTLDGGGSVAADGEGNVYVVWHAAAIGAPPGEQHRAVWVAKSEDDGKTFTPEVRANLTDTGACGCCGLRAFTRRRGDLLILYRTATRVVTRDMHLLTSSDRAASFSGNRIHAWNVPTCVMSMASFCESEREVYAAWETEERVYFGRLSPGGEPIAVSSRRKTGQKHPVIASNSRGEILIAWTEGTGWKRGGALAWQAFDSGGQPIVDAGGTRDGTPVWSFPAAFATRDGKFVVVY